MGADTGRWVDNDGNYGSYLLRVLIFSMEYDQQP